MGLAQPLACPVGCHVAQSLPGASVSGGGSAPSVPTPPPGQSLLVDDIGNYLIDDLGNYLTASTT